MIRNQSKPFTPPALSGLLRVPLSYAPLLGLVGVMLVLVWPVLTYAAAVWSANEDLQFGFLVPPIAALLVWWRRESLQAALRDRSGRGSILPLLLLLVAAAAFVACQRLAARSPTAYAAGLVLWAMVAYLGGWRAARVLAFPIGFVAFALGLQPTLISPIAFALQGITARGAAVLAHGLGVPVVQQGLVLRAGAASFLVAEACSGMNSLLALLALAGLWLNVTFGAPPARLAVLASVPALVIGANTLRVALVLLVGVHFGQEAALGFFHGASSFVLFGLALAGLLLVSRITGCKLPLPHSSAAA